MTTSLGHFVTVIFQAVLDIFFIYLPDVHNNSTLSHHLLDREDVHLPAKRKGHRTSFLGMLEELMSALDEHQGRIKEAKYKTDLLNDDVRPVHFTPY